VGFRKHKASRSGPAVLLALLLSVLLGAPAPASPVSDAVPTGLKQVKTGKAIALARVSRRASDALPDVDDPPDSRLGSALAASTGLVSIRPAAGGSAAPAAPRARIRPAPFHARAPPAA
jgi:hypothetical protein